MQQLETQDSKQLRLHGTTPSYSVKAVQLRMAGLLRQGLRRPQIGALHASLAHLTRSGSPATIVMPTGTGKTETMLALNAHECFERLLVVVPNDALREQVAGKFETFGVLRRQECLSSKLSTQ